MENGSSKSEDSDANEDIETKATKVEIGDNFVVNTSEMEDGDPFLSFCAINLCISVKFHSQMVGVICGVRVTWF
jgi:hypothetical protein